MPETTTQPNEFAQTKQILEAAAEVIKKLRTSAEGLGQRDANGKAVTSTANFRKEIAEAATLIQSAATATRSANRQKYQSNS
jgi:hypothetical protein